MFWRQFWGESPSVVNSPFSSFLRVFSEVPYLMKQPLCHSGPCWVGLATLQSPPGPPGHPGRPRLRQIRTVLISTAVLCDTQRCFQTCGNLGAEVWLHPPNFRVGPRSK